MVLKTQLRCLRIWLSNISIFEITVLILSLLGVIGIQVIYGKRTYDDAFITYRYARNISQGLGFVYNLDKHVLGTTTPLYTLLLVLVARLIGAYSIPKAAFIFGSIADALNVWLVYLISRSIFKNRLVAIIVAMTFLLQPLRIDVASGGMETPLFLTFLLLMYKSYLMKLRFWWTSIWMALAFLTRPDALIAILPLCIFWYTCDRM
jgi:Gpi18-like mannosyltransferase